MKRIILKINKGILFACVSMYFGTGWSLILFQFNSADSFTPDNYFEQFVPQVTRATEFFTVMTIVMMISAIIMIIEHWKSIKKWFPITVLAGVFVATLLTMIYIFPYNQQMAEGITQIEVLHEVLDKWMNLNVVRVSIWTVEWLAMLLYFLIDFKEDR
ncbi:anthrone oxygenase family protein [Rhodohalobacter sp.]|uniref:anthrone oxygenase family protein n=1 Tax=Rhodohalobacter sp. TaxID=1974210 RepID=UPI002ACE3173|nr:anthrone oxygenase family protein [Rhodohalobacter sp.]MDZ7757707.1 anthrone oxygenase family protein [Rhodohalobacter sp.]